MSTQLIVTTREQLAMIVREAVAAELDERGLKSSSAEWTPLKSCGFAKTTVRSLIKKKLVRGCVIGRELHVHASDLAKYVNEKATKPEPANVVAAEDAFEAARARARARRTA